MRAVAGVGDLLVAPTRIVLDGRKGAEVILNNIGEEPASYRVSVEFRRMTEAGDLMAEIDSVKLPVDAVLTRATLAATHRRDEPRQHKDAGAEDRAPRNAVRGGDDVRVADPQKGPSRHGERRATNQRPSKMVAPAKRASSIATRAPFLRSCRTHASPMPLAPPAGAKVVDLSSAAKPETGAGKANAATGLAAGARVVSYLPMAHIAERVTTHYGGVVNGYEVTTCPDLHFLASYLGETKPRQEIVRG